jgi:putative ABC transport system permease protein
MDHHYADFYKCKEGAVVHILGAGREFDLKAIGVATSPEYIIASSSKQSIALTARNFGIFFVPLPQLQRILGADGMVNEFGVLVKNRDLLPQTIQQVEEALAPYGVEQVVKKEEQVGYMGLKMDIGGMKDFAWPIFALPLIVAAISIYITMSRLVRSQRGQVGLMRAMGYSKRQVLRHYLIFALFVALIGSALGVALG